MERNFCARKIWWIWQMLMDSPNFNLPNILLLKFFVTSCLFSLLRITLVWLVVRTEFLPLLPLLLDHGNSDLPRYFKLSSSHSSPPRSPPPPSPSLGVHKLVQGYSGHLRVQTRRDELLDSCHSSIVKLIRH